MLNFFFIRRYRYDVLNYVRSVYFDDRIRYSLDLDSDMPSTLNVKYSERDEEPTNAPDVKFSYGDSDSERGDDFDPYAVSLEMQSRLAEEPDAGPWTAAINRTFVQKLRCYILERGLVEADVYKAALMDRRLFSKMMSNDGYKPSKDTVLALIFALRLSWSEATDMLERAGYSLSHSIKRDIMIEYFIIEGIYNLRNVNAFLYHMGEKIIGRDC